MIRVFIVFLVVYFWISALVYADIHVENNGCDPEMGMIMDSLDRNQGCDKMDQWIPNMDKDYFKEKEETLRV